jgi:hypothetical protein
MTSTNTKATVASTDEGGGRAEDASRLAEGPRTEDDGYTGSNHEEEQEEWEEEGLYLTTSSVQQSTQ